MTFAEFPVKCPDCGSDDVNLDVGDFYWCSDCGHSWGGILDIEESTTLLIEAGEVPETCSHCGSEDIELIDDFEVYECSACGWTWASS